MASQSQSQMRGGQGQGGIPPSLQLTDYLRPVFQEAFMIREYCLFTNIQHGDGHGDPERLVANSVENELSGYQPVKVLTGLYVIPSVQSSHLWFGLLSINNERSSTPSPWHGGVFRFIIKFPENYPSTLPTLQLLPMFPSPSQPNQYIPLQTHPDVSPTTGQFNLRPYYTSSGSSSSSSSSLQPRIYKILRSFRKSFYRSFAEITDPAPFMNPSAADLSKRDYGEFLRLSSQEAGDSLKYFKEVDSILLSRFKSDGNLVLLGENSNSGTIGRPSSNNVRETNSGKPIRRKAVGLSFL